MAWKQCASLCLLRQNKTGAFISLDQMLLCVLLQSICLSKAQNIFWAALRNRVAGDPGHKLPPSGAEYRKQHTDGFTLEEGTLLGCQLPTQLPPHTLVQWHWCPHEDQTRAKLSKSLTHPKIYIGRALGPRHQLCGFGDLLLLCHTTW